MAIQDNIDIKTTELEPCRYRVDVEVPATDVDRAIKIVQGEFGRKIKIPGFRPGRAPRHLITRRYADAIADDVRQKLVRSGLETLLARSEFELATMPELAENDMSAIESGRPFSFSLEFDVSPSFELPEYKGMKLSYEKADVEDGDVDSFIKDLLRQRASFDVVNQPAKKGDMLRVGYAAANAERDIPDSAKPLLAAEDTVILLGEPEILPGVIEGLSGRSTDESVSLSVTFPDDHVEDFLAGKTFEYTITIKEVHSPVEPELDDVFAKSLDVESVDELKKHVKAKLTYHMTMEQFKRLEDQVSEYLVANTDMVLPQRLLELEKKRTRASASGHFRQLGLSPEQLDAELDKHEELYENIARKRLTLQYITESIAKAEEIVVGVEEVDEHERRMMEQYGRGGGKQAPNYDRDALRGSISADILRSKVLRNLVSLAEISEQSTGEPTS